MALDYAIEFGTKFALKSRSLSKKAAKEWSCHLANVDKTG